MIAQNFCLNFFVPPLFSQKAETEFFFYLNQALQMWLRMAWRNLKSSLCTFFLYIGPAPNHPLHFIYRSLKNTGDWNEYLILFCCTTAFLFFSNNYNCTHLSSCRLGWEACLKTWEIICKIITFVGSFDVFCLFLRFQVSQLWIIEAGIHILYYKNWLFCSNCWHP